MQTSPSPDPDPASSPTAPLDTQAPALTNFSMAATSTSLLISGIEVSATDDVAVTGYFLDEETATPFVGDPRWSPVPLTSFTFSGAGTRTLHAWAKDAAGNISNRASASVLITLPPNIPDGPHPRIWLTPSELNALATKRDANTASWSSLLSWCDSHLSDAGYNIDPANQDTLDLTNWGSHNNYTTGYRMSGFATHLLNFALAHQVLKAPGPGRDLAKATMYATRVRTLLVDGIAMSLRAGEENNGLKAIRVGSLHDITINASEAAVLGIGNAGYKQGYSARNIAAIPIAYDWIHETLSSADKDLLTRMMLRWFDWLRGFRSHYNNGVLVNGIRYHEDQAGDCTGTNNCTVLSGSTVKGYAFDQIANNFGGGAAYLSLLIPVALYGDNADIPAYLDVAKSYLMSSVIQPLESDLKHSGGDSPEGWNYGGGFLYTVLGLYGYYTGTQDPAIPAMTWISSLVKAAAHRVGWNYLDIPIYGYWTGTPYGESRLSPVTRFAAIEQRLRPGSTLSGIGAFLVSQPAYSGTLESWEELLFRDPGLAQTSPEILPKAYLAKGNGLFMSRSSWTDPNTVHVTVRLEGKVETAHEGYDEGHISLARGPDRLLLHQNSIGDAPPSVSFNTVVFNGQSHHAANPALNSPSVNHFESGANYAYVSGDITNAYKRAFNMDRALLFRRSVLHIHPGHVVVYDITRSNPAAGNTKEWYSQLGASPTTTADTISATVGSSKIYLKTLYPAGGSFTTANPAAGYYRVKYAPAVQQEYEQFLHVIEATNSESAQTATAALTIQSGTVRGTQLGNSVAVFSSNADGSGPAGMFSYQYAGDATTTHYLAMLTPGTSYNVTASGGSVTCAPQAGGAFTASNSGLLVLSITTAGAVTQQN